MVGAPHRKGSSFKKETPHPGELLKQMMEKDGLDPKGLAKKANVDTSLVVDIIECRAYPSKLHSARLGEALAVGRAYLFNKAREHRDVHG